ncbi:MFS transporter [Gryllotalpicola koreensis]|uniref:MFS transporter n=1 Tax=Gryllotalpicola koreensis TaxID=993086 RepID=A0ABP7ZYH2_9MICO
MSNPIRLVVGTRALHAGFVAVIASALALGMLPLAIILSLRSESLSLAATAAGAFGVGNACGVLLQGRILDRHDPRLVISLSAAVTGAGLGMFAAAAPLGAVADLVLLCVAGLGFPAITAAVRAQLPIALSRQPERTAAYAVLSLSFQGSIACGPVLAGVLAPVLHPRGAIGVAASLVVVSLLFFARSSEGGARMPQRARPRAGSLRRAIPLFLISAGVALPVGALSVAVPAVVDEASHESLIGWVLACLPIGEGVGALVYGSIRMRGTPQTHVIVSLLLVAAVYCAGTLVASVPLLLSSAILLAGLLSSPIAIGISTQLDTLVPDAISSAYSGVVAASIAGSAAGSVVAGALVGTFGATSPIGAAALACAVAAGIAAVPLRGARRLG